jgi:hypothetical protein
MHMTVLGRFFVRTRPVNSWIVFLVMRGHVTLQ